MEFSLFELLSIRYEGEEDQKYIRGLLNQFEQASNSDSYHLALFAYHLIFMIFIYQTIYKAKIWKPQQFATALITLSADERRRYLQTKSVYAFVEIKERSIFELLNLFEACEPVVSRCKKNIIDYRNRNLGHANMYIVSENEFENKIDEYNQIALEIHKLTHENILDAFEDYFKLIDYTLEQTADDFEINLIVPNRMSLIDLGILAENCLASDLLKKKEILKILQDDFSICIQ